MNRKLLFESLVVAVLSAAAVTATGQPRLGAVDHRSHVP
jgi:hypothetical protein